MSTVSSNSNLTGDAGALGRYLHLTKECMDRAQNMTLASSLSTSPKFNSEQCKYLADKLRLAVESADSFLVLLNRGYIRFPALKELASCLRSFKLLYALSKEVESFTQDCCKDTWIQAALTLANVSEHISSVGFYLELWSILFGARRSLTQAEVDSVFETEVDIVKKKASLDMETLSTRLDAILRSTKSRRPEHQLVAFVLDRLHKRLIPAGELAGSSQSSLAGTVLSLKQKELQQLGKGTAATVYRWTWLGAEVVVKTFDGQDNADFNQEVSILRRLFHPNIISLFCFAKDNRKCSIVMEKMDGDLHSLILARLEDRGANESPFCILEGVDIMLQIGGGMNYLHESRIAHRDLKSLNILVRCVKAASELEIEYVVAKVADFGVSKTKLNSMTYSNQTPNVGTTRWMAPELIKFFDAESNEWMSNGEAMGEKYPFKCDIYSFAMVCYEILTGDYPFSKIASQKEVKRLVLKGDRPNLPDGYPNKLKDLIERCWSADPDKRPSFADICKELRQLNCSLLTPPVIVAGNSLLASSSCTSIGASSMTIVDYSNIDYLEQAISSVDVVQKLLKDQKVQLNPRQCKYLSNKLTETQCFLREKSESLIAIRDSPDIRRKALLQLHFALKRAEKLVRGCCCGTELWLESAVTLADIKEDIMDILLDLQWWASMIDIAIALVIWMSTGQKMVLELLRCAEEDYANLLKDLHLNDNGLQLAACEDEDLLLRKLRDVETSYAGIERTAEQNRDYLLAVHVRSRLENSEVETMEELNVYDDCIPIVQRSFGAVMDVRWMGRRCALKMLRQSKCKKEASILSKFQHPHIVKFYRYWDSYRPTPNGIPQSDNSIQSHLESQSHILMEVLPMNLVQHLEALTQIRSGPIKQKLEHTRGSPISEDMALDVMLQLVKALWHLTTKDVAHCFLIPNNVLVRPVSEDEVPELSHRGYLYAKLAGFSRAMDREAMNLAIGSQPSNVGTIVYDAPEAFGKNVISDKNFHYSLDVWSFGVVFCEILSGKRPFPGVDDGTMTLGELQGKIKDGLRPELPEGCPDYLKFIISSCWQLRRQDRPNFSDLLRMIRLAQVRSLGFVQEDYDLFTYKTRDSVKSLHLLKKTPAPQTLPKRSLFQSLSSIRLRNAVPFFIEPGRCFKPVHQQTTSHKDSRSPRGPEFFSFSDCRPFGYLVNQVWPPIDPLDPSKSDTSKSDTSKMDVIFFEGNVAKGKDMSCKETWVQRGKPNVGWPRDWLPEDLGGDVRVLLLEYSISDDGVEGVLEQLQNMLVFRDRWNRGRTWDRPIVLVGHSLGCVMIEHLVVALDKRAQSFQRLKDETEISQANLAKEFLTSLAGCFFYAPPWAGLVSSDYLLKDVFGGLSYSRELFSDLCYDSSNPSSKLKLLSQDFMRAQSKLMKLKAVTEGYHTRGRTVVPPHSMQDFAGRVVELGDSNHADVCKPTDKQHRAYRELFEFVADILENSKVIQNPSNDKQPAGILNHE